MIQFNPDGSIKMPSTMQKDKDDKKKRMESSQCIKITKEVQSFTSPKKCCLHLECGKRYSNTEFVENITKSHSQHVDTPIKLQKESTHSFKIFIGTDFKRCQDCTKLISKFNSFASGNSIVEKGNCPYESWEERREFTFEDYFE